MHIKLAIFLGLVTAALVVVYFCFFAEWSWKKVVAWIVGICAAIAPLVFIDHYRLFIIAVMVAVFFEIKHLTKSR